MAIPDDPETPPMTDEILESHCRGSRVHALIHRPITEASGEG
jgi:hypothetical protein